MMARSRSLLYKPDYAQTGLTEYENGRRANPDEEAAGTITSHTGLVPTPVPSSGATLAERSEEVFLDSLFQWAETKLPTGRFSCSGLFQQAGSKITFPRGFDKRKLSIVMSRLRESGMIRFAGNGRSERFDGNPGIGALYEVVL